MRPIEEREELTRRRLLKAGVSAFCGVRLATTPDSAGADVTPAGVLPSEPCKSTISRSFCSIFTSST